MKRLAALLLLVPSACVAPRAPAPPPPVPTPTPRPTTPVVPASSDWRDWPYTPGTWSYRPATGGRSSAVFGSGGAVSVELACDRAARRVRLSFAGPATAGAVTIRTSSTQRSLPAGPAVPLRTVVLAANDPILDAMGFSRGRFVIEQSGTRPLVLPTWAEILRVAEDCRS